MKVKIGGVELDVLTKSEVGELIDEYGLVPEPPRYMRIPISQKADANGNAVIEVYTVPPGRMVTVTRLVIEADGFTPGTPFQAAGAYAQVRRQGGQMTDFLSLAAPNGLPAISTDSDSAGGRFINGETIEVNIVGTATLANVGLHVYVQALEELADDVHRAGSRGRHASRR